MDRFVKSDDRTPPSLLIRVRNRDDQTAWREFEARYRDLIERYCLRRGLQQADCDDVQQITWLHLSKGMRNFEYDPGRGRFRDYLGRVVCSAIARHFARPKPSDRALDELLLTVIPDDRETSDGKWEQEWADHHFRMAMDTIARTFDRRSVQMFGQLIAGVSVADVAAAFDASQDAVHKVKQRIRDRMQALIAEQIREEDEPHT
ncbi:MAG: sigma-70 family RNA polymerase sigma factor [Phycisphaerales bacterium]|nr:sigma-70 family RNA polymerase sigma factor [Phycisphaerales bacterium]